MFHTSTTKLLFLSTLFLSGSLNGSHVLEAARQKIEDPFAWQNEQHFKETCKQFAELSKKEFPELLNRMIAGIDKSPSFFKARHAELVEKLQNIIFNWMNDEVLTYSTYLGADQPASTYSDEESTDSENQEYDYPDSSSSDEEREYTNSWDNVSWDEDAKLADFEAWKVREIYHVLGISVDSSERFTQETIDLDAIATFLNYYVKNGYSWLINEEVEYVSECLSEELEKHAQIPQDMLCNILESLWFDYDWEEFRIQDPLFIAKTYKQTLVNLRDGKYAQSIKQHILKALQELFTFNPKDFHGSFQGMKERFNKHIEQHNLLGALIEWSVYCTYRKVFAEKKLPSLTQSSAPSLLPTVSAFNKQAHVEKSLQKALERAHTYYSKVYLHESTTKLVFEDETGLRGELSFAEHLKNLKSIGKSYEPHRLKNENVFVPQLHIIVQTADRTSAPEFIEVPLLAEELALPARPLTRAQEDKIFPKKDETAYYAQVKKDYVNGSVIQGKTEAFATTHIEGKINNPVAQKSELIHSERVLVELLRKAEYISYIVKTLSSKLEAGEYLVHGIVMLGYSTNSVCEHCTPTLVALMNSHEAGGFLRMLADELSEYYEDTYFHVPFSESTNDYDWTAFRMNIFVTARINFDCQANDLTQDGQREHTKNHTPLKNALSGRTLIMPNHELILSDIPQCSDGSLDQYQRYFFEFVGKDMHSGGVLVDTQNVIFSSGTARWSKPQ